MSNFTQLDINALKERRKLSRITMRELYEAAGLCCTQYMAIEGGHRLPTEDEWLSIQLGFHIIDGKRDYEAGIADWVNGDRTETIAKLAKWNAAVAGKGGKS